MSKVYRCCRWIVEKLKEKERLTYEDFEDLWNADSSINNSMVFSKRNFHRYQEKLRDIFGIEIVNEGSGDYAYYLKSPEKLNDKSFGEWILNTLAIGEKLNECQVVRNRIIVEDLPPGGTYLETVTDAMKENQKLIIIYQMEGSRELLSDTLEPYCVVLHHQRWFVLGKLDDGKLYTFALDRLKSAKITGQTFRMDPDFNAKEYLFKNPVD